MNEFSKFVGLDVHKATIAVAVADKAGGEPRFFGEIPNTSVAITKLMTQLAKGGATLSLCYEAGCCGYVIHRQLTKLGYFCQVVAPSLIPKKAGDRVKTDRRDSLMLARLRRRRTDRDLDSRRSAGSSTRPYAGPGRHQTLAATVQAAAPWLPAAPRRPRLYRKE